MADLHRLPYNKMVYQEALRLYPPIWGQPREAIEDDDVQGYAVPKGSVVSVCQSITRSASKLLEQAAGIFAREIHS